MLSNTYAIRAGAQQFASAADGMRQKANRIMQNNSTLQEKWLGLAADAFHSVSNLLEEDVQTASHAFEQASQALHLLADQLDQVNSLRQQIEYLTSEIQSLEWSRSSSDDQHRSAISSEISQLAYRRSNLQYEADSLEHQANTRASTTFDDISRMVNHLHFLNGANDVKSSDSSVMDKVGHFFSGLWNNAETAVEDAYHKVSQEFQKVGSEIEQTLDNIQAKAEQGGWFGGIVGFTEGFIKSITDSLESYAEINPANIMANAILHPEATYEKAKAIFIDLEHPVQTAERLWDGAKVLWTTLKQSFNQDIINGNSFTRSNWGGYAAGLIAQAVFTGGAGALAKGESLAVEGVEKTTETIEIGGKGVSLPVDEFNDLHVYDDADKSRSLEEIGKGDVKFETSSEYYEYINNIGKREDLSSKDKIKLIQEAFEGLENKVDVNCPADEKYIKGFGKDGRVLYDWPDQMGFAHESIKSITKDNPLPEKWDRYGSMGGDNFATIPQNGLRYTYDQRAIPYVENPYAYHSGTFDNKVYFEVIDALRTNDLNAMNRIRSDIGLEKMDVDDFDYDKVQYNNYLEKVKREIGNIDATYGLSGEAAPWVSNGEKLMQGGAGQIITPFNGNVLKELGVLKMTR